MLITDRQQSWLAQGRRGAIYPALRFVEHQLELGAGTVIARMTRNPRQSRGLDIDGRETRILALLSAAYRRPISPEILDHIRRAGREWGRGEACLAQIHLAFAGLPRLIDPEEAAYRLYMAEGLLDDGISPRDILRALDLDPTPLDRIDKAYYDTESRVPAGSGRPSGRWTDGTSGGVTGTRTAGGTSTGIFGTTGAAVSGTIPIAAESFLSRNLVTRTLVSLGEFAAKVTSSAEGPAAALGLLFIPSPGSTSVSNGEVPGHAGMSYHWDQEEGRLLISTETAGVSMPVVEAHVGLDGIYEDQNHQPIARVTNGHLVIESRALPSPSFVPDSVWSGTDDETAPATADLPLDLPSAREQPQLCPDPGPDVPHGASERSKVYQERITGLRRGLAVWLNGEVFDGCRLTDGTMLEAKAWGYARFIDGDGNWYKWFRRHVSLGWQLWRESVAAGDRRVEWHVAEEKAADAIRAMAQRLDLQNVDVIYDP